MSPESHRGPSFDNCIRQNIYAAHVTNLIEPELGRLVTLASLASVSAYATLPNPGGYEPRQDTYVYKENEAGWPSNARSTPDPSKEDTPLDWRRILGVSKASTYVKLDVADIPQLAELVRFVVTRRDLGTRLSPLSPQAPDEAMCKTMVSGDAVRLVATTLNRAASVGDFSEATLLEIYRQLEQGLLADELRGDLIYPLALRRLEISESIKVSEGVFIEPLTPETQLARAISGGSSSNVNPYLVAAATHAVVLKNRTFDNRGGSLKRQLLAPYNPPGLAEVDLVCEALAIVSGLDVGYAQVCVRPDGWADDTWKLGLPPVESLATVSNYPLALNDRRWLREHEPVGASALERLPGAFAALRATDRRARLASRRLAQTARREFSDDALIDACIGIEALLSQEHTELTHRMGLRAATALVAMGWKPSIAYQVLKKVYDYRSAIVHGDVPKKSTVEVLGREYPVSESAIHLLRELLDAHLSSEPPWTPAILDEELFYALGRGRGDSPQ
jgi:hypothetical protein